jgi:cyclopropane-fatty-acyl-phospholipid synthase
MSASTTSFSSSIFHGTVFHQRNSPCIHTFSYPLFSLRVSVDELPLLHKGSFKIFSHNSLGLFSLYDNDYLSHATGNLRQKVEFVLSNQGVTEKPGHIDLISHPRLLGYVFNPVSFFFCYRLDKSLIGVIAEVHNTFGEKHVYVLSDEETFKPSSGQFSSFKCEKQFHVSPFFDRKGDYRFVVSKKRDALDIRVSFEKDHKMVFTSRLLGKKQLEWGTLNLLKSSFSYPGSIVGTMPRIIYQAALLKWRKKLHVFTKPIATHPMTIETQGPGILQRTALSFFKSFLDKTRYGSISFKYSDAESQTISGTEKGPQAELIVHNYDLFLRSLFSGDVGFGESYVENDWDSGDLLQVLQFFCVNQEELNDRSIALSYLGRFTNFLSHLRRKNTLNKSAHNIQAHYDLSNELFSSFLDKNLLYSSALFNSSLDTLEQAQINKMDALIEKACLSKEDHLLEIGCGWGALAIHAAKKTGCKVTGITLSREQKVFAEKRIQEAGLSHLVSIQEIDYRNLKGSFDKIISVEMIEAVGYEFLETFFSCCNRLLKKDGLLVLQAITMPEQRYEVYRRGCDWIQKYIFPGGHCPSFEKLLSSTRKSSDFVLQSTNEIGLHYAKTLSMWRDKFNEEWDSIATLGFDERFKRIWNYYLTYCEAGFSTQLIYTHQMVFSRPEGTKRL